MAMGPWILFFPSILHHKYLSLFRLFFILAKHQSPKHLTLLLSGHRHLNLLRKYIHPIHPLIETKEIYLPDRPISGEPKKYLSLSLSLSLVIVRSLSSKFKHFATIGFVSRRLMCWRVVNQVWVWVWVVVGFDLGFRLMDW